MHYAANGRVDDSDDILILLLMMILYHRSERLNASERLSQKETGVPPFFVEGCPDRPTLHSVTHFGFRSAVLVFDRHRAVHRPL